jgi:probable F420-dependent oxidoreductase
VKFWQAVSMVDIGEIGVIAQKAEALGFEGIILSDHLLTFARQLDFYEGSEDGKIIWDKDTHWPDPWVQIGALSQLTRTLKFLTAVYILPMRDPFNAAKLISTAALLSENRVLLGVGIGWQEAEFNVVGKAFKSRGKRTDEMLDIIKMLMSGQFVEHRGQYFQFDSLNMSPAVTKAVPVYVGGLSDAALRRAARNNGWIGAQHDIDELKEIVSKLIAERARLGVDPNESFEIVACIRDYDLGKFKLAKEMGVTKIYKNSWLDMNGRVEKYPLEKKLEEMERFAAEYIDAI